MKCNTLESILWGVVLALLLPSGVSCQREEDVAPTVEHAYRTCLSFSVEDLETASPSKTVLSDPDIETKITTLTLAFYRSDGSLWALEYYASAFERMEFELEREETYTIYALANMGDMRSGFPQAITGDESLGDISYTIPGYTTAGTGINDRGIPMAGKLLYSADSEKMSEEVRLPLRRLLAKVAVDLSVHWEGTLSTIRISNLNGRLMPFGTSRAAAVPDILTDEEIASGGDLSEGTFVFYVPENVQGDIAGIGTSAEKSRDNTEAISPGKAGLLTYMTVTVEGKGRYEGTLTYRSYLGSNATSNFSIERNSRYTWKVDYLPDGTFLDDWKHENELAWWSYRYKIQIGNSSNGRLIVYSGDYFWLKLFRADDRYEKGTLQRTGEYQYIFTDNCIWTLEDYDNNPGWIRYSRNHFLPGITTYDFREYVAVSRGSGYIRGTLKSEQDTFTDRVLVTCQGEREPISLTVTPSSIELGESVRFKVMRDHLDLTSGTHLWYLDKGSFAYVGGRPVTEDEGYNYVTRQAVFTPTIPGTYEIYAIYAGTRSNSVTFTVSEPAAQPAESYVLAVTPANPEWVYVGEQIRLKAWLHTYRGETLTASTEVTSRAAWTCEDAAVQVENGVVTSSLSGPFTVRASLAAPDGNTVSATVQVMFLQRPVPDTYLLTLSPKNASLKEGDHLQYSCLLTKNGIPFTPDSGEVVWSVDNASVARVDTEGMVSAVSEGTTKVRASYRDGMASDEAALTVSHRELPPIGLAWLDEPRWIAQRGLLRVESMPEGASISSATSSDTSVATIASVSGNSVYVNAVGSGNASITVTTSLGQTESKSLSVAAPFLRFDKAVYSCHPDGEKSAFALAYWSQPSGGTRFSISSPSASTACGMLLHGGLFESLLSPQVSLYRGTEGRMDFNYAYDAANTGFGELWYRRLSDSSGTLLPAGYNPDTYQEDKILAHPKREDLGISGVEAVIRPVALFRNFPSSAFESSSCVEDWSRVSNYIALPEGITLRDLSSQDGIAPALENGGAYTGVILLVNGVPQEEISFPSLGTSSDAPLGMARVRKGSGNTLQIKYPVGSYIQTGAAHKAGRHSIQAFVRNRYSRESLRRPILSFHSEVHGAIGASVLSYDKVSAEDGYRSLRVWARFLGEMEGTPYADGGYLIASAISSGQWFDRNLGSHPYYVVHTRQMQPVTENNGDYILDVVAARKITELPPVYIPSGEHFDSNDAYTFMCTTSPELTFDSITQTDRIKKVGNVLYLRGDGEPVRSIAGQSCGYYVLHLLSDIQVRGEIGGNKGWINNL